jgi:hypothetical protein
MARLARGRAVRLLRAGARCAAPDGFARPDGGGSRTADLAGGSAGLSAKVDDRTRLHRVDNGSGSPLAREGHDPPKSFLRRLVVPVPSKSESVGQWIVHAFVFSLYYILVGAFIVGLLAVLLNAFIVRPWR